MSSATTSSLNRYRAKRNFERTPEPGPAVPVVPQQGPDSSRENAPRFVVQKHWASRLHYDFRLELDGVLKSWAVPKGPSLDPRDKRMAIEVEDHPLAYADFEGEIPPGQYGAGKVLVWDRGTWQPKGNAHQGLEQGSLKFELRGHKLKGEWALVRMKTEQGKQTAWLLIKEKDDYAQPAATFSVVDEMPNSVCGLAPPQPTPRVTVLTGENRDVHQPSNQLNDHVPQRSLPQQAIPAELPQRISPQLATLVDDPPEQLGDWLFEVKFDGYRLLAKLDGEHVRLLTRNGNDWTERMPTLAAALQARQAAGLPPGWYDGEVVVLGPKGVPDFQALQQAFDTSRTADLVYFLFDVPYGAAHDLRAVPQAERRALLRQWLLASGGLGESGGPLRWSETFDADPAQVVQSACRLGLEGVIGKRLDAPYVNRRASHWIKLKCGQRQEFVVGGYTDPRGSRVGLGALLVGFHEKGRLHYVGSVGTGFDDRSLATLKAQLLTLDEETSPFAPDADLPRHAHWVRPVLVAEVSFSEWTQGGHIRHPVFHGLRNDKPASAITRENPQHFGRSARITAQVQHGNSPARSLLPPGLRVTNPERVMDAVSGTTKMDLVRYYALVANLMLPHLKKRPLALVRAPDGVGGELFFQKHTDVAKLPGFQQLDPALYPGHPPMLEVVNMQGLLSAAQWNVLEIHTQNAVAHHYAKPDRLIFDLDPGEGVAWAQMQEAASLVKALLDELGLRAFLKTSGGKGLHVVVPIKRLRSWDAVKDFSQAVVAHLAATLPQRFVLKSGPKNRVGKIFADYLRNGVGATTVAAWSPRARPGLGISVPVEWAELASLRSADQWTVGSVHERLGRGNQPWDGYAASAQSLTDAAKLLGFKFV